MTISKIHCGIRLEPVLVARCKALATEQQTTFSELVRLILWREVGVKTTPHAKRNGRRT
jgi:hypothetical protein